MTDFFGLPPDGYQKPLYLANNLTDLIDKNAARVTLGAAAADDVLKAANPIGTIIAFYGSTAPYGYLPCSGQTISSSIFPSLVTFLGGTTSATLPDLRGEFLRGWDNGRGVDPTRTLGSWQKGSFLSIGMLPDPDSVGNFVNINSATAYVDAGLDDTQLSVYPLMYTGYSTSPLLTLPNRTSLNYGVTRPRNVSVLYCMKAYDAPVSQNGINIANIAANMVTLDSFIGTNQLISYAGYQKLPGGLIIQWGRSNGGAETLVGVFPLAFPTACISMTSQANDLTPNSSVSHGFATTNTGWSANRLDASGTTIVAFTYIALGY